jgi:hypothetical protein
MTTVERDTTGPLSIYKNLLPNSRAYFKITHATAQGQTAAFASAPTSNLLG